FTWNEDCTLMIGLSPTGRATIEALELNRKGIVNLRRVLHERGLHPVAVQE
ncbi:MAG: HNH endonuclease, partial [Anaerolineae bacterium]|nr:HNH endonuclease [Anaerolineae bacterium]